MTRNAWIFVPVIFSLGCKKAEEAPPVHSTCKALDDRGITNRLDNVRTNNQELFALDGHCLEATHSLTTGAIWGVRFAPETPESETPDFHVQLYFNPPNEDVELIVEAPERRSPAECITVPSDNPLALCGHVDDNSNDNAGDDVDLRGKTGVMDLTIAETESDGVHKYEGELEWALYAIDASNGYTSPSLRMWATFHWAHPDGAW